MRKQKRGKPLTKGYLVNYRRDVVLSFLLLESFLGLRAGAQFDEQSLATLQRGLDHRVGQVENFQSHWVRRLFKSEFEIERIRARREFPDKLFPGIKDWALCPRVYEQVFWAFAGNRWRFEGRKYGSARFQGKTSSSPSLSHPSSQEKPDNFKDEVFAGPNDYETYEYSVFDGETLKHYNWGSSRGYVTSNPSGKGDNRKPRMQREILFSWGEQSWSQVLTELEQPEIAQVDVQGEETLRVRGRKTWDHEYVIQTLWIAIDKGFAVRKFVSLCLRIPDDVPVFEDQLVATDFQEVYPEFWMPMRTKHERFIYPDGKRTWSFTHDYTLMDVKINQELDPGLFCFRFPLGVNVEDLRTGKLSLVGGPFPRLIDLAQEMENQVPLLEPPPEIPQPAPEGH